MANGNGTNPLTETDLARMNTALDQLKGAQDVIDMATRAGIDVKQFADRAAQARDQLLRVKNTFFPGR